MDFYSISSSSSGGAQFCRSTARTYYIGFITMYTIKNLLDILPFEDVGGHVALRNIRAAIRRLDVLQSSRQRPISLFSAVWTPELLEAYAISRGISRTGPLKI